MVEFNVISRCWKEFRKAIFGGIEVGGETKGDLRGRDLFLVFFGKELKGLERRRKLDVVGFSREGLGMSFLI